MKNKFYLILILSILFNTLIAQNDNFANINVIKINPTSTKITIQLDSITTNIINQNGNNFSQIKFSNLSSVGILGKPDIPVYSTKFNASKNNLSASIKIIDEEYIDLPNSIEIFQDLAKGADFSSDIIDKNPSSFPENILTTSFNGLSDNIPISSLYFFPIQVISEKRIRILKKVEIIANTNQNNLTFSNTDNQNNSFFMDTKIGSIQKSLTKINDTNPLIGKTYIKIKISNDGIYRIDYKTLKKLDIGIKDINPQSFAIFNNGRPIPIFVYGEKDQKFHKQDYIEFIGKMNPNSTKNTSKYDPFSDVNIYQLFWNIDNALRFSEESADPVYTGSDLIIPVEFDYDYHFEKNETFQRLGHIYADMLSTENDQYFFSKTIFSGSSVDFEFELPSPNQNTTKNISIRAKLQSISQGTDHTAHLLINGQNVGQNTWKWNEDGYIEQNPEFYLPNNFLKPGKNTLTINLEHNINDQTSAVILDWLEIHYYRDFVAENDYIEFNKPSDQINGLYQFNIGNFTSNEISIYKNDNAKITKFQKSFDSESNSYSIRMQDAINSSTYYVAAAGESIALPDSCYLDTLQNILDIQGCDHLCIVADEFYETSKELKQFYSEQGIDCYQVKLSDVYNQFNNGIVSPYAIRNFLKSAYNHWEKFPKWLLLIGDANLENEKLNFLPTSMYQTYKWGGSASDFWYSLIVGDDNIPDIAVGRWACGTERELEILLDKRINYTNNQPVDDWRNKYLFIAGKEDFFKEQTDYFTENVLKPPVSISRILINPSNLSSRFYGGTDTLISRVNKGVKILNFVGHGGGAIWADRSLLRLEDLYKMKNSDKLSFFSSLTCFTADFAAHQSLGEAITELYSGGAIGLFGSSGVGWVKNDFLLGVPLHKHLQNKNLSIGEIINLAKIDYITKNNAFGYLKNSMIFQYNLLGDPGVMLAQPDEQKDYLSIENKSVQPNSNINFSGELPYDNGQLSVQIYDNKKYPISPVIPYSFTNKNFSNSIFFPDSTIDNGYLNIYGTNSDKTKDFISAIYFSSEKTAYSKITLTPEIIEYGDNVLAEIDFITSVDSVFWEIDTTYVSTYVDNIGLIVVNAFPNNDNTILSIKCDAISTNKYKSKNHFTPTDPAKYYAYRISWYIDGEKYSGEASLLEIKEIYDISISSIVTGGISEPAIETTAYLTGHDTISSTINVYASTSVNYSDSDIIFTKTQKLIPLTENSIFLPIVLGKNIVSGTVEILGPKQEKYQYNNYKSFDLSVNNFLVTPGLGSSFSGETNDTLRIDDNFYIHIPANSVTDSCVISIVPSILENLSQPDFRLIFPKDSTKLQYNVKLSKNIIFGNEATIGFSLIETNSKTNIIRYETMLDLWTVKNTTISNETIIAKISNPGSFSVAEINDIERPGMEINFDGKRIEEQSYVGTYPMISFAFNDDNGINLTEEGFKVWIDEEPIAFSELNKQDSILNTKNVSCSFRSNLESGSHYLKAEITDAAGNKNESEIEFSIYKNLKIMDYGNYPNPFQTRTWFVFETTKDVEEFKINIYTSSGRKIRTIDDTNIFTDKEMIESGYHEVSWDGKDDNGDNIANGVYYYKMIAKTNDKTVSTKGVIAKVK